ncbi:MAG: hypothetical protein AB1716_07590 [Planctomycetota bacterium]
MVRNLILAISTLAVLILLFLAYATWVGEPATEPRAADAQRLASPAPTTTAPLTVANLLQVPGGQGKIIYVRYDENTGRPSDWFSCSDWQPISGPNKQIRVSAPQLAMLLPSGMLVTVSGDEGQIQVDRMEQAQMRPRVGWLSGNVRISMDRGTDPNRPPPAERPADVITVMLDQLDFDLDRGELKTSGRVAVTSDDFEIAGVGLHLLWNQAENRVDALRIAQGKEFVLYTGTGLLGERTDGARTGEVPATSGPAPAASAPARPRRAYRQPVAYTCSLEGDIVAEQYEGVQRVGSLAARRIDLVFDTGAGGRLGSGGSGAAATRPAREERGRLVLRWTGPLELGPTTRAEKTDPQRRFIARGAPVVLTRGEGVIHCAKIEYHEYADDVERVWLSPGPDGPVQFGLGADLTATAAAVYIDRAAGRPERVIKLIGDVSLHSQRKGAGGAQLSSIRASQWAELRAVPTERPTEGAGGAGRGATDPLLGDPLLGSARLDSAVFVGDVVVNLGEQTLTSARLDVRFRDVSGKTLDELLDTATADGGVRLASGSGQLDASQLAVTFDRTPEGRLYPQRMEAVGAAQIARGRGVLRGARIVADLAAPIRPGAVEQGATEQGALEQGAAAPGEAQPGGGREVAFVLRRLHIVGHAELIEPDKHYAARGREIVGVFEGVNQLARGTVVGTSDAPGFVHRAPYTVIGEEVVLDRDAQNVHVDGRSWLSFSTNRSLQGERRSRPTPVEVTSTKSMDIDGRANVIRFEGEVLARTAGAQLESEELQADSLVLHLQDADAAVTPASAPADPYAAFAAGLLKLGGAQTDARWGELWRQVRGLSGGARRTAAPDDFLAIEIEDGAQVERKEPARLEALKATVIRGSFAAGENTPLSYASLTAPRLDVDFVGRQMAQIVTTGVTQLLLTDRRGVDDEQAVRDAVGLPSALLTRGASQTAMQCQGRMTYTLGPAGPDRRDTAVFEEAVLFVHRTGREMVGIEEMLPAGASPETLMQGKSRAASLECDRLECWFAGASGESDPSAGALSERGGGLGGGPGRLASLLASGHVFLQDRQESRTREINAAVLEFNREQGRMRVLGDGAALARIWVLDTTTQRWAEPFVGPEIEVNLADGTIAARRGVRGEIGR